MIVRFALLVSATFPVPALVALKLVTALPLPVRLMPPFEVVVSSPATTPFVPPLSLIVPPTPVPPSAVSVSAFVPSPEVSTLPILIPPVLFASTVPPPPVGLLATAALTLIAPVWFTSPIVSVPDVFTVASSAFDNSSLPAAASVPLPRSIALAAVFCFSVIPPAPVPTVPPDSAILSELSVTAPLVLLTAFAV